MARSSDHPIPSVITPFQKPPASKHVVDQAIEHDATPFFYGDVPFIAHPGVLFPPIAGGAPGAGGPHDIARDLISFVRRNVRGLAVLVIHADENRGTKNPESGD